jgi:AcrR family transcriptional regulator
MDDGREEVENKIIKAATKVFIANGYKGATMRNIATEANINLAMLNYYFRSKDNLFDIIFDQAFGQIYGSMFISLSGDKCVFEKIRDLVSSYITVLLENPSLPNFIFSEIAINPDRLTKKLNQKKELFKIFDEFQKQIDNEVISGKMKPFSFLELFLNIESLCAFPFIVQPMLKKVFNVSDKNYTAILKHRKTSVADLLINGLKI